MEPRFTVHGQSTTCPNGYARVIWYVWDREYDKIVAASTIRALMDDVAEKEQQAAERLAYALLADALFKTRF